MKSGTGASRRSRPEYPAEVGRDAAIIEVEPPKGEGERRCRRREEGHKHERKARQVRQA